MTLNKEQLNILNHVVVDGQAWADNASEDQMLAKVERHKQAYLDAQGENYMTRKQRDEAEEQADQERYDNVGYDVKRSREYAPIPEQLDYIYHNGIEKWKADMILPVKEKFPKG